MAIGREHGLIVIEDCAHAIETTWRGQSVGTFGDYGCFSFYVTKNVITAEGGMILTRDGDWADRLRVIALHGMSRDAWKRFSERGYKHYDVVSAGFKNNMTDLQAALGIHQLARVEATWARRRKRLGPIRARAGRPARRATGGRQARRISTRCICTRCWSTRRVRLDSGCVAARVCGIAASRPRFISRRCTCIRTTPAFRRATRDVSCRRVDLRP